MDKYLVASQSLPQFAAYFFAWWNAWVIGSEYAARYNNVDFTHKVFWTVYGLCVVGMLMHTGGGIDGTNAAAFCFSCAGVHVVVGGMTLRVALQVDDARVSGLWHGSCMLTMALLWGLGGLDGNTRRRTWCWLLSVVAEPLTSVTFLLRFKAHLVPITRQYAINKFAIICVLALGSFVAAAVGGVDPSTFAPEDRGSVRLACFFGFVLFMNFK